MPEKKGNGKGQKKQEKDPKTIKRERDENTPKRTPGGNGKKK
jgi:hypothetical protein